MFLQAVLNFLIVAFCIFMIVKVINKFIKKKEAAPAKPTKDQELLTEIRDLLKAQAKAQGIVLEEKKAEEKEEQKV